MNSIELNVDIKELYSLTEFVDNIIEKQDFQVNLILEEIFVNIVNYSNTDFVKVNVEFKDSILTIEFIDNGMKFNPLLKENPEPPDDIEDVQVGGLGIYLTKEIADEMHYNYINNENHLKIIKKLET